MFFLFLFTYLQHKSAGHKLQSSFSFLAATSYSVIYIPNDYLLNYSVAFFFLSLCLPLFFHSIVCLLFISVFFCISFVYFAAWFSHTTGGQKKWKFLKEFHNLLFQFFCVCLCFVCAYVWVCLSVFKKLIIIIHSFYDIYCAFDLWLCF